MFRKVTLALVAGVMASTAHAAEWQKVDIKDGLDLVTGKGEVVRGTADTQMGRETRATLQISCTKNETRVILHTDGYTFFNDPVVRYRLDDKPPARGANASEGADRRVMGWWGGPAITILKAWYGAKTVRIEATNTVVHGITSFTFDIEGLQEAVAGVAADCKWGK